MKRALKSLVFVCVVGLILFGSGRLLLGPKKDNDITHNDPMYENRALYQIEEDTLDVIFVGSSHNWCTISPEDLFEDYGIASYVYGSNGQKIWQSYYYIQDAFRHQTPRVCVVEVFTTFENPIQTEESNRGAIDYMEFSKSKVNSINCAYKLNPSAEDYVGYYFPTFRYHDRWKSLDEIDYSFDYSKRSIAKGFYAKVTVNPASEKEEKQFDLNIEEGRLYLDKIKQECDANNCSLVLYKAPTYFWNQEQSNAIKDWAKENEVPFLDFNYDESLVQKTNIDWERDTIDWGNHLNYYGAQKVTNQLGNYLCSEYPFEDRRIDPDYSQWGVDYNLFRRSINNAELSYMNDFDGYTTDLTDGYECIIILGDKENSRLSDVLIKSLHQEDGADLGENGVLDCDYIKYENDTLTFVNQTEQIATVSFQEGFSTEIRFRKKSESDNAGCIFNKELLTEETGDLQIVVFDPQTEEYVETSVWTIDGASGGLVRVTE